MTWDRSRLCRILEAALFASAEPLSLNRLQKLFDEGQEPAYNELEAALADLTNAYTGRGVRLVLTGGGYQFQTDPDTQPWVQRLFRGRTPRLSRAVLETLAIIAYRQPTTRAEIEDIRGVSLSSGVLKTLSEHRWIRVVGRKEAPGRPLLYGTTPHFLSDFGLRSLEDLPPLSAVHEGESETGPEQSAPDEPAFSEADEGNEPPPNA